MLRDSKVVLFAQKVGSQTPKDLSHANHAKLGHILLALNSAQTVRRECTAKMLAKVAQYASHAWRENSQHILAAISVLHAPGESTRTKAIRQAVLIGRDVYIHKVWVRRPMPRSVGIACLH